MIEDHKAAISIIEGQIRGLTAAGANPGVIRILKEIVSAEKKALGDWKKPEHPRDEKSAKTPARTYHNASLSEIEKIIEGSPTRSELESIAIQRFNVPKGSIRSLGGKDGITRAITSFIRNQKTHEAISDLASRSKKEES